MSNEARQYQDISPLLAFAIKENQLGMTKFRKLMFDMMHEVNDVYEKAATSVCMVVSGYQKRMNEMTKEKFISSNDSFVQCVSLLQKEIECQAGILKSTCKSLEDCFLKPLKTASETKKSLTKNCYSYVETIQERIKAEERNLTAAIESYQIAASKVNTIQWNIADKHHTMYHDAHNTYLLQLEKYNSSNKLLYTEVLPQIMDVIKQQQQKMNTSILHHSKYMATIQREALEKMQASFNCVSSAFESIDLSKDLVQFVKTIRTTDSSIPRVDPAFPSPSRYHNQQLISVIAPLENKFVLTASTKPNLQRRYKALRDQTNMMLEFLTVPNDRQKINQDLSQDLAETFRFIEKEFNLNVALNQMELYSTDVTDSLNLPPSDSISNAESTSLNEEPHDFKGLKSLIPLNCYYCHKMVMTFHKGFICKSCRMVVHKKCAINIPFCLKFSDLSDSTADVPCNPLDDGYGSLSSDPLGKAIPPIYAPSINGRQTESANEVGYRVFQANLYGNGQTESSNEVGDNVVQGNLYSNRQTESANEVGDNVVQGNVYPTYYELLPENGDGDTLTSEEPLYCDVSQTKSVNADVQEEPVYCDFNVLRTELGGNISNEAAYSVDDDLQQDSTLLSLTKKSKTRYCVALKHYTGSDDSHLSFDAGDKIEILDEADDTWWKGKCAGKEGFFPQNFVLNFDSGDRVLKVLYPFVAQYGTCEMSVDEGQILLFLDQGEAGWVRAKSIDAEGYVPASYVESL